MPLQPHTPEWYDRLATLQPGYYYPWRSWLGAWNGEDAYLALVRAHLHPEAGLLDVARGHGEVALDLAPLCRSVLGYDRIAPWIERAQHTGQERGVANATCVSTTRRPRPTAAGRAGAPGRRWLVRPPDRPPRPVPLDRGCPAGGDQNRTLVIAG